MIDNPNKFADKYSIKSSRLANWDYSSFGYYFVTICTLNHNNFFGKINNGEIKLSKAGEIIHDEWLKTEEVRKNIKLNSFVIMPNHLRGIVKIKNQININVETPRRDVSTNKNKTQIAIQKWKPNSIGSIINQFKSVCTKKIRSNNLFFAWQTRFYDHIIRDQKEYFTIKKYIENNINNWEKDKYYLN